MWKACDLPKDFNPHPVCALDFNQDNIGGILRELIDHVGHAAGVSDDIERTRSRQPLGERTSHRLMFVNDEYTRRAHGQPSSPLGSHSIGVGFRPFQ
jgi:hypothetical protein